MTKAKKIVAAVVSVNLSAGGGFERPHRPGDVVQVDVNDSRIRALIGDGYLTLEDPGQLEDDARDGADDGG